MPKCLPKCLPNCVPKCTCGDVDGDPASMKLIIVSSPFKETQIVLSASSSTEQTETQADRQADTARQVDTDKRRYGVR